MTEHDAAVWEGALRVARALEAAGHRAYLVGGCVRDRLLGRPLHDADIATSARPEQVMVLFPDSIPTGLRHGTLSVRMDGRLYEVTTFRVESGYSDARHPDAVTFVEDIEADLARRDFTINAIAVGTDGQVVDPFGGRADLAAGVVRCVGAAEERFREDALRMLRAIRFAAELGFRLLPSVWKAIRRQRERIRLVAMERIAAELDRMTKGSDPDRAWALLIRSGLVASFADPLPALPDLDRLARVRLAAVGDAELRWPLLLIAGGADEAAAEAAARSLRMSRARAERWKRAVGMHRRLAPFLAEGASGHPGASGEGGGRAECGRSESARDAWVEATVAFGKPAAADWLALAPGLGTVGQAHLAQAAQWLRDMPVASVSELAVRGNELAAHLGRPPGPWVGDLLRKLLAEAAAGRVPNERNALLDRAVRYMEREGRQA